MYSRSSRAYQLASGLALLAAFLIVWLNAAAGLIGMEDDDPTNLLYAGVLVVGCVGATLARFQPRGLAKALLVTALAQLLVGAVALNLPNTASPTQIVILHGVLVALFVSSSTLFRYAARKESPPRAWATG
jgi:hypothetical protein